MNRTELQSAIRARETLFWITTREERRVESEIYAAAGSIKQVITKSDGEKVELPPFETRFWDCSRGITKRQGLTYVETDGENTSDPAEVLEIIRGGGSRRVWVLRDLPPFFNIDFTLVRAVKSLARDLTDEQDPNKWAAVVILTPRSDIPEELQDVATVIEWPLPSRDEIASTLDFALKTSEAKLKASRDDVVDAAVGLSTAQAERCFARSLVASRTIDPGLVAAEKKRVISGEAGLEWFDPEPEGLDAIGGLENLKDWLKRRRVALSADAREYGLPSPRGILVTGIPGCGKSLTAKAVPSAWGIPLLRLDPGLTQSKFVGESEANFRRVLNLAETVAPCVLWIDEIEKALSGSSPAAGGADGGVKGNILGSLLTFLQERTEPVFVVATSNDFQVLPSELLRRGRFDEVFWVELPNPDEREAILRVTLKRFGREIEGGIREFTDRLTDWSGAEIASLVPEALFEAYADNKRDLKLSDLESVAAVLEPQSKSQKKKFDALREAAAGKVRLASRSADSKADSDGRSARFAVS